MTHRYYFIKSADDATAAPIYIVKAGESQREISALADLHVAALVSDDIYFCAESPEVLRFVSRLFWQNPNREFYEASAAKMRAILKGRANAGDAKNLSQQIRSRKMLTAIATHDTAKFSFITPQIFKSYAAIINHRKPRR